MLGIEKFRKHSEYALDYKFHKKSHAIINYKPEDFFNQLVLNGEFHLN